MLTMWIEQWLDLFGYEVTLGKDRLKSLSKRRSRIYGAHVRGETVPDREASGGEWPFPIVFLFVVGTRSVKLSEDERSWREGVHLCSYSESYLGAWASCVEVSHQLVSRLKQKLHLDCVCLSTDPRADGPPRYISRTVCRYLKSRQSLACFH